METLCEICHKVCSYATCVPRSARISSIASVLCGDGGKKDVLL